MHIETNSSVEGPIIIALTLVPHLDYLVSDCTLRVKSNDGVHDFIVKALNDFETPTEGIVEDPITPESDLLLFPPFLQLRRGAMIQGESSRGLVERKLRDICKGLAFHTIVEAVPASFGNISHCGLEVFIPILDGDLIVRDLKHLSSQCSMCVEFTIGPHSLKLFLPLRDISAIRDDNRLGLFEV